MAKPAELAQATEALVSRSATAMKVRLRIGRCIESPPRLDQVMRGFLSMFAGQSSAVKENACPRPVLPCCWLAQQDCLTPVFLPGCPERVGRQDGVEDHVCSHREWLIVDGLPRRCHTRCHLLTHLLRQVRQADVRQGNRQADPGGET